MRLSVVLTWCLVALATTLFSQVSVVLEPLELSVPEDKTSSLADYQLVSLNSSELLAARPEAGGFEVSFRLETPSGTLPFRLSAYDLRGPNHRLRTAGEGKLSRVVPRKAVAQFKGRLATEEGGVALFTLDDNFVVGSWEDNDETFFLEPLWRFWPAAPDDAYVMYSGRQVNEVPGACGVEDAEGLATAEPAGQNRQMGGCLEVDIALAADFELFQVLNSAASVENFMLDMLARVQANYDDEFDDELTFVVVATVIATSEATDPWTNSTDGSDELLPDFGNWGNSGGFGVDFDVASLWTNRDLDGTSIGWAYLNGVCRNNRYGIMQTFSNNTAFLRVLWAHELGHNFGANHDASGSNIMAESVNSSVTWSTQSQNAINSYYQGEDCLAACPNANPPLAAITTSFPIVCENSAVTLFDASEGDVTTRNWQFPGAFPSTSTAVAPSVAYSSPGVYTVTLSVSNDFGSDVTQYTVRVTDGNEESFNILLAETFDGEDSGYLVVNPDDQNTWELTPTDGNVGETAAVVNNYDNDLPGQVDQLVFPRLDLSTVVNPMLSLEYAYRRYSSTLEDQLIVRVNTPSGSEVVFTGDENGSGNFATGEDLNDRFFPKDEDDWCFTGPQCIEVDLSAFANETSVQVVVENINGYGNYMYVDNLFVYGTCISETLPVEWLSFTAQVENKTTARLNWSVHQEEEHAGFTVQRASANAPAQWTDLAWVPSNREVGAGVGYTYLDPTVLPGTTYTYRLQQEDIDGATDYSPVQFVSFAEESGVVVQPNPTTGLLSLQTNASTANYTLHDVAGRAVLSGKTRSQLTELNLTGLTPAVYLLRVGGEVVRVVKR